MRGLALPPERVPLFPQSPPVPAVPTSSSRLIADGDSAARNAFRVGLREDTPLPIANTTQELDPNDILEVRDMAEAIARAELIVRAPRSSGSLRALPSERDIFDALVDSERPTDDTAGPATHKPATLTPIPPAPSAPRYVTMPSAPSSPEDDAYYHPAGRMRSLADVTLDGYRPEPTLLMRARSRRKSLSWILAAALVPLVALAAFAIFSEGAQRADAAPAAQATGAVVTSEARLVVPATAPVARPAPATSTTTTATTNTTATPPPNVPVFDVKSLPTAAAGAGAGTQAKSRGR